MLLCLTGFHSQNEKFKYKIIKNFKAVQIIKSEVQGSSDPKQADISMEPALEIMPEAESGAKTFY